MQFGAKLHLFLQCSDLTLCHWTTALLDFTVKYKCHALWTIFSCYWLGLRFISCNCIVARCLINFVYFTAWAFIRSWWRCTFWIASLMALNQQKHRKLGHKSESVGKLINRIPGLCLLISSLPGLALRTHVESLGKPRDVNKRSRSLAW